MIKKFNYFLDVSSLPPSFVTDFDQIQDTKFPHRIDDDKCDTRRFWSQLIQRILILERFQFWLMLLNIDSPIPTVSSCIHTTDDWVDCVVNMMQNHVTSLLTHHHSAISHLSIFWIQHPGVYLCLKMMIVEVHDKFSMLEEF